MVDLDNIDNEKINIYTNPSNGIFTIYGLNSSLINIYIIDAFGKTVLESKQKEFDLSTFSDGLYNVIIEKENGELIIKKISLNK